MDKFKEYLSAAWEWLKSRQKATLLAGAAIGALIDDPVIATLKWIVS